MTETRTAILRLPTGEYSVRVVFGGEMSETRSAILRLLTGEYIGDLDARDLAQMIGVPKSDIQRELHAMTRAGLLEPRAYRLFPGRGVPGLMETALEREVLSALVELGPLSRADVALSVTGEQQVSGGLKVALENLHTYAHVSPPRCPWVSKAGIAAMEREG